MDVSICQYIDEYMDSTGKLHYASSMLYEQIVR